MADNKFGGGGFEKNLCADKVELFIIILQHFLLPSRWQRSKEIDGCPSLITPINNTWKTLWINVPFTAALFLCTAVAATIRWFASLPLQENAVNGDHLWMETSCSGELCYLGEEACLMKNAVSALCHVCFLLFMTRFTLFGAKSHLTGNVHIFTWQKAQRKHFWCHLVPFFIFVDIRYIL